MEHCSSAFEGVKLPEANLQELSTLYSNRAPIHSKLEQWEFAAEDASKARILNGDNLKAIFCGALAKHKLHKHSNALAEIDQVEVIPGDSLAGVLKFEIESAIHSVHGRNSLDCTD